MKNKKTWIVAIVAVLVIALMAGLYFITRSTATEGEKTFTLTVVHSDSSTKEFTISTDEMYLAHALITEGIITDEGIETGMYFTVDGEAAIYEENSSYWAIYVGDSYATEGLNTLVIEDGGVYKLEYTIG